MALDQIELLPHFFDRNERIVQVALLDVIAGCELVVFVESVNWVDRVSISYLRYNVT